MTIFKEKWQFSLKKGYFLYKFGHFIEKLVKYKRKMTIFKEKWKFPLKNRHFLYKFGNFIGKLGKYI